MWAVPRETDRHLGRPRSGTRVLQDLKDGLHKLGRRGVTACVAQVFASVVVMVEWRCE